MSQTATRRTRKTAATVETSTAQENTMSQNVTVEELSVPQLEPITAEVSTGRKINPAAKEALAEYREKSKAAKKFLSEVLTGQHPEMLLPDRILEAIRVLVPVRSAKEGRTSVRPPKQQLLDKMLEMFLVNNNKLTLMDIFKEFRMGEGEMRVRMRNAIHDRKPEERMWITYDHDTETYELIHVGAEMPDGWSGARPKN